MSTSFDRSVFYRKATRYTPYLNGVLDVDLLWPKMAYELRETLPSPFFNSVDVYNNAVGELLKRAINDGQLCGVEAFQAIDCTTAGPLTYHGSRLLPKQLEGGKLLPQPPFWRDKIGHLYRDGDPAICFSDDRATAVTAALASVREADDFFAFGRSRSGRLWRMITRTAFDAMQGATVCVYATQRSKVPTYIFDSRFCREPERRAAQAIDYEYAVRLGASALPPDVLVIDASKPVAAAAWEEVMHDIHPLDSTYASIEPAGGIWDVADHPYYRNSPVDS